MMRFMLLISGVNTQCNLTGDIRCLFFLLLEMLILILWVKVVSVKFSPL